MTKIQERVKSYRSAVPISFNMRNSVRESLFDELPNDHKKVC